MSKPKLPVLRGYLDSQGLIHVWCPYCRRPHTHGWGWSSRGVRTEHRHAHCDTGSPFLDSGYLIGLGTDPPTRAANRELFRLHDRILHPSPGA